VPALLSAEITAKGGADPGLCYDKLAGRFGAPRTTRVDAPANAVQRQKLARLTPAEIGITELAGEKIVRVLDHAPGNNAAIGGIKVEAASGWFAARPSGTEDIYKIYAESFKGDDHLHDLLAEAQQIVDGALAKS
jgi:phosphoglucomutase